MTWSCSNKAWLRFGVFATATVLGPTARSAPAQPRPTLALPVACDLAIDCAIQKYVDRAAGPERQDYRCGRITTDGHDGIDFRLRRTPDLARDIPVLAAAAGTVLRRRDGMPDTDVRSTGQALLDGKLAGNSVVIDHGDGWETQYSHLKLGSVSVRPGDKVQAGGRIAAIGMSGNAEFPHLHFELRRDGQTVDPFAPDGAAPCGTDQAGLWTAVAQRQLGYREIQVIAAGFTDAAAKALDARHEMVTPDRYKNPGMLILWGVAVGARDGDVQTFTVTAPDGAILLQRDVRVATGGLDWVGYSGLKKPASGWPPGRYSGRYELSSNGKIVEAPIANITVDP